MKLEIGMRVARQLKELGGEKAVAIAALDELREYSSNFDKYGYVGAQKRLSDKKRVILGLGFSEFLADPENPDNDEELGRAAEKAGMLRSLLELDPEKLLAAIRGDY